MAHRWLLQVAGGGAPGGPHSLAGGAECNQTQVTGRHGGCHPSRAGLPTWRAGEEKDGRGEEEEDR